MANVKITDLPAAASVVGADLIPVVISSGPTTKKITVTDFLATLPAPGADQQVIYNEGGVLMGNAQFSFNSATGVATVLTASAYGGRITDHLEFGSNSPFPTVGFIQVGHPTVKVPIISVKNSVSTDSAIVSTSGDGHYFGEGIAQHIYDATFHSFLIAGNSIVGGDTSVWKTKPPTVFSTDLEGPTAHGTDIYFFVSGSIGRLPNVVDPERKMAVFGGDVHVSGTMRVTVPSAGKDILTVDDVGTVYPVINVNGASGTQTFCSTGFLAVLNSYGTTINGNSAGVTAFDGRNSITTDLAVVSQRLNTTFNSLTGTTQPQNTNLSFAVNASEIWEFEINGTVRPSAATGARFAIMAPSGSSIDGWIQGSQGTTGSYVVAQLIVPNTLVNFNFATLANIQAPFKIFGTLKTGVNAGNLTLGVSGGGSTGAVSLISGSHLKARRATSV